MLLEHATLETPAAVPLQANLWVVKAIDHSLQVGAGFGLSRFLPTRRMTPLDPETHARFSIKPGPAHPAVLFSEEREFRWCVRDLKTSKTWLETSTHLPASIHLVTDMGTVGWQAKFWMEQASGLSCTWRPDLHHRVHNDVKLSVQDAGLIVPQTAATALLKLGGGPWSNQSYQLQIADAARSYFEVADAGDYLYRMHYEDIAADVHPGQVDGSGEHMQQTFERLKECTALWQSGTTTKSARWFAWFDRASDFLPSWHALLLVLSYLCMQRGWIHKTDDLPVMRACHYEEVLLGRSQVAPEDAGEGAGDAAERFGSAGDALKALASIGGQAKSGNRLHLAALLLGNHHLRNLVAIMVIMVHPLRHWHGKLVKQLRSPEGSLQHIHWEITCGWEALLSQVWATLNSEQSLNEMGFRVQKLEANDGHVETERGMAGTAIKLGIALVSRRLLAHLHCCFGLPERLAGLIAPSADTVRKTLEGAKKWFNILMELEEAMSSHKFLRDVHWELQWPCSHYCRWLLFSLSEVGFKRVPATVAESLRQCFSGFQHSQPVEDVFHFLREDEARSPNHVLGRQRRWQLCCESTILEDHGRPQIQPAAVEKSGRRSLPGPMFEADSKFTPTLSSEVLSSLTSGTWWSSPGPQNYALHPLLWMALGSCWPKWERMQNYWYSLFCVPGSLLRQQGSNKGGMVLVASQWGALLWRVHRHGSGQDSRWTLAAAEKGKSPWLFVSVDDLNTWDAMCMEADAPAEAFSTLEAAAPAAKVTLRKSGDIQGILHFSAARGFPGVTLPWLKKLLQTPRFGVAKPPKLEKDCVEALLLKLWPRSSKKKDIEEIMRLRQLQSKTVVVEEEPEHQEPMPEFDELLGDDDMGLVRAELQRYARSQTEPVEAPAAAASRKRKGPLPLDEDFSLETLQKLLPVKPGCRIWVESNWHHRYRGKYPKPPPNSVSKCWGENLSKRSAAVFVIKWLWSQHRMQGGEACPWDLDASD